MRSSGLGRQPREEMTAESAVEILDLFDAAGVAAWLDGGWAVDAVLGEQRRGHDDLDVVVRLGDVERLIDVLARSGFELATGYDPHRQSYDDVWVLSERFDLLVPEVYRGRGETYPRRDA